MPDPCYLLNIPPSRSVVLVYVHVALPSHVANSARFVGTYVKHPPGYEHRTVVVCNGGPRTAETDALFAPIPGCEFLQHDNSGQDIGAYQKAAREVPCDLMVFFGSSTYFRKPGWLVRMVDSFEKYGPTLYGATGNRGDMNSNVYPHIRTTAFWMPPALLNNYPNRITRNDQRYPFEHGTICLTSWICRHGMIPLVVSWDGEYSWENWDLIPNGYHQGNQDNLLVGDRLTEPPYYHTP